MHAVPCSDYDPARFRHLWTFTTRIAYRISQAILELAQRDNSFEEFSCTGSEHWGRHARQVRVYPTLCKLFLACRAAPAAVVLFFCTCRGRHYRVSCRTVFLFCHFFSVHCGPVMCSGPVHKNSFLSPLACPVYFLQWMQHSQRSSNCDELVYALSGGYLPLVALSPTNKYVHTYCGVFVVALNCSHGCLVHSDLLRPSYLNSQALYTGEPVAK